MTKFQTAGTKQLWIVLALVFSLFVLDFLHLIDFHEAASLNLRFLIRGPRRPSPNIVLVEIDDASLSAIGYWPWARSIHAVLLDVLARHKPRFIFYDVLFTDVSTQEEDEKLSFALEKTSNVILPFYYYSESPFRAFLPIKLFLESARGVGFVNTPQDRDGFVRRMRISIPGEALTDKSDGSESSVYYSAPVLTLLSQFLDEEKSRGWLKTIPSDKNGFFFINYPGTREAFIRVPFRDVINAAGTNKDAEMDRLFHDKFVVVGHTAAFNMDVTATPFSKKEAGVIVQASALNTLLTGSFLYPVGRFVDLLILILLAIFVTRMTNAHHPRLGFLVNLGMGVLYASLNYFLFSRAGLILPLSGPLIIIGITYVTVLFLQYLDMHFQGELLGRELNTAAAIQDTFLPKTVPDLPNLEIAFECRFAKQVGGDLYDWVELENENFGVCVGDVAGKGVPAAIYMARSISDFRRENKNVSSPAQLCASMNELLLKDGVRGMFVTLIYAVVCPKENKLSFANAGHDPIILYRHREKKADLAPGISGRPLGLFPESTYETIDLPFESGDLLLMISDGVKDVRNPKGEHFGVERICRLIEEYIPFHTSKELVQYLFDEMQTFRKGLPPADDRTIVCIRHKPHF